MSTVNLLEEVTGERRNQLYFSPPSKLAGDGKPQDFLIFMITGNPGLISYYHPFLSTLYSRLLSSSKVPRNSRFYIYGHSMKGFDASKSEYEKVSTFPVGLAGQIEDIENLLFEQLGRHRKVESVPPKVILMGHSVGAYILLELIRQHRKRIDGGEEDFDLIGGILLFPTITHIAKSPQGMMYDKLLHIPYFALVAGAIVNILFYLFPTTTLSAIVKLIMRYPEHAAETTAGFIKSPMGVRQALHLAKDEMETINEDKWETEIWEAATSSGTNSRDTANKNLFFYWGKNDKLVANKTRDELIDARDFRSAKGMGSQEKDWKPIMEVDMDGIPHAFCIKHSEFVAEKVTPWIEQIVDENCRENCL